MTAAQARIDELESELGILGRYIDLWAGVLELAQMTEKALRDLNPGDVVDDYGIHRTVADVRGFLGGNGYPLREVTYLDGESLTHDASYKVKVVER